MSKYTPKQEVPIKNRRSELIKLAKVLIELNTHMSQEEQYVDGDKNYMSTTRDHYRLFDDIIDSYDKFTALKSNSKKSMATAIALLTYNLYENWFKERKSQHKEEKNYTVAFELDLKQLYTLPPNYKTKHSYNLDGELAEAPIKNLKEKLIIFDDQQIQFLKSAYIDFPYRKNTGGSLQYVYEIISQVLVPKQLNKCSPDTVENYYKKYNLELKYQPKDYTKELLEHSVTNIHKRIVKVTE